MKVCLVNPPAAFLIDQGVFPPLGLWSLQAVLEAAGHEVRVVDLGLGDALPEADVFGVTGTTPQADHLERLVRELSRRVRVIAGGPHATLYPEDVLGWGAAAVVKGEGERAIFRALWENGIVEAPRMTGPELDELPLPNRQQTWRYNYRLDGEPCGSILSARGCPFHCGFCSHAIWGQRVSFRSAESVLAEVRQLQNMGMNRIKWWDDTFLINRKRLHAILDGMMGLGMKWVCFCRADVTTQEDLAYMKAAGCVEILIGVESGDQRILDNICKGTTVAQNTAIVQAAKTVGIRAKTFIITGLPGEDEESLENTKRWLVENKPEHVGFTIYMPYRATPVMDHPERYDIAWEAVGAGDTWITGRTEEARSHVWTKALSRERITQARREVEEVWQEAVHPGHRVGAAVASGSQEALEREKCASQ